MLKPVIAAAAALVVAAGLWAFEPWRVLTSSELDEPLPGGDRAVTTGPPARPSSSAPAATDGAQEAPPVALAEGDFVDAEHETSGSALVLELSDGRRFLRLERLASSDGPDLHVWLTDRPSGGAWGSYDDGRRVRLGELKATHGNQNYPIPPTSSSPA